MSSSIVDRLAPTAPKCFDTRLQWVEYLRAAQVDAYGQPDAPFVNGEYNAKFNFCADCTAHFRARMRSEAKCNPHCLRQSAK